jgi:hypothetical protein
MEIEWNEQNSLTWSEESLRSYRYCFGGTRSTVSPLTESVVWYVVCSM